MQMQPTPDQVCRHDGLLALGNALVEGELLAEGSFRGRPGWFCRRKLKKALGYFRQVLQIHPQNWSVMWTVGKVYQRLGLHDEALRWFSQAHQINPDQADVAREAGIAAIETGQGELAISFLTAAIAARPDAPGLVANLALAHLVNRDINQAKSCAAQAVERDQRDEVSRSVLEIICEVEAGTRPIPNSFV